MDPSTGQSLTLPKIKTRMRYPRSYLGYDPIEKQFKVLSMTWSCNVRNTGIEEYHVLTLGTQEPSWRMTNCCRCHLSADNKGICINGDLYYEASVNMYFEDYMIACFVVRSEKFRFIQVPGNWRCGTPINYNGKLGSLVSDDESSLVGRRSRSITLHVLEDAEKQEWLEHVYILPASWRNTVGRGHYFDFIGVTLTNVIVLSRRFIFGPPVYVIYYNTEKNTAIRVQIKGIKEIMHQDPLPQELHTFLDHVEDVKLMQMF